LASSTCDDDTRLAIDLGKHQLSGGLPSEERHGAIRDVARSGSFSAPVADAVMNKTKVPA